jgi:preprotein translocase subunit SecG
MENILLIILLIIALALIGVVLLQRSEGGGLGIGGGGGGGLVSSRGAANALTKATWALGAAFMIACIILTVIQTRNQAGNSVIDRLGTGDDLLPPSSAPLLPPGLEGDALLPPSQGDAPLLPPAQE